MLPYILGINLFQHCRPYIKKHVSTTITDSEFILLNSIVIAIFTAIYIYISERETFSNITKLSFYQIIALCSFAIITIFTSLEIFRLEEQSIITTHMLLKSVSFILFIIMGIFIFGEKISKNEMIGFILITFGIIISQY